MSRLIITLALLAVVGALAYVYQNRRATAQVATANPLPSHVDRSAFIAPNAPWLLVVFSSASCLACADVWKHAQGFEQANVAVQEVEVLADPELHGAYNIDSVPSTLVVDAQGIVKADFVGPLSPADIDQIAATIAS